MIFINLFYFFTFLKLKKIFHIFCPAQSCQKYVYFSEKVSASKMCKNVSNKKLLSYILIKTNNNNKRE